MFATYTFQATVANGASTGIVIKTGSVPVHLQGRVISSGSTLIRWHENTTITASALLTPGNMNRYVGGSGAKSVMTASFGASPDIAAACWNSLLWEGHIAAGGKVSGGGGDVYTQSEWILNANETYVVSASNAQGANVALGIYLEMYED